MARETERRMIDEALRALPELTGRVLAIVPDLTRQAPVASVFRALRAAARAERLDVLVALGTHPPLSEARIEERVGISQDARTAFYNHEWDRPDMLVAIGRLDPEGVGVRVNRRILDYDRLVVIGPVFPHEVAGFSGGNKYFFPGISGPELLDYFHWLGAIITNPAINGHIRTPVREVIDRAAAMIPVPITYVHLVPHHGELRDILVGDGGACWEEAARRSARINIRRVPHRFRQVLGLVPPRYEDLWTAGKAVYKSEPVVEDGGEVIVYAPHIDQISVTHGAWMERIGYHVRDYFTTQEDRFADVPGAIRAHSTHVRGVGTYQDGVEKPRIQVTLATAIDPETCARINLGYRDPASIDIDDFQRRDDVLVIPDAGEVLYRQEGWAC
jgi:nickel-dependent lactate racemase